MLILLVLALVNCSEGSSQQRLLDPDQEMCNLIRTQPERAEELVSVVRSLPQIFDHTKVALCVLEDESIQTLTKPQ